ncbi:putative benzoate 4-monooxygenase cytochrome [Phaeomoniella chlamydospora]|uniref:Putative benzoate 4-monooxygenase cytochrome n=1 Tax=Phaeomoniella chlamydospora TaxID=158046 RepID=A0A0G2GKG2_PHACM|nr:putative benzoate 4-monooxygenase cytochrome [Phaeomoniella chlamydospora]
MLADGLQPSVGLPILFFSIIIYLLLGDYIRHSSLRKVPGPPSFALTRYRLAYSAFQGHRCATIHELHEKYGPVVRVTPTEISFSSLSALRTIYGAGSGFERTDFYRMFDVYGAPNLFSFRSVRDHRERKKLLSHAYSNQMILNPHNTALVEGKVAQYINFLRTEPEIASETFASLHYFSFDTISEFMYGPEHGGTKAMVGNQQDRNLLYDILHPSRRRLAWFAVHFPAYTKWITTRVGLLDRLITKLGLLPMRRPFMYSGIRSHALRAFHSMKNGGPEVWKRYSETTILGRLLSLQSTTGLTDMEIASECADQLLAGIDTTSDSSMFLIWALSRPENKIYQDRLRAELLTNLTFDPTTGVPELKSALHLPYLNAVIRETLRLYAPLPTSEPRSSPVPVLIDNHLIPAGTTVSMSPYTLHRSPHAFPSPLTFNPERWLLPISSPPSNTPITTTTTKPTYTPLPTSSPPNQYFWSFSSGGRMCIGLHLAMAEMTCLIAAIYGNFETGLPKNKKDLHIVNEKKGTINTNSEPYYLSIYLFINQSK